MRSGDLAHAGNVEPERWIFLLHLPRLVLLALPLSRTALFDSAPVPARAARSGGEAGAGFARGLLTSGRRAHRMDRWIRLGVWAVASAATLSAGESADKFVRLFDGRTWDGWDHPKHLDGVWEIADGVIRLRSDQPKRERGKSYDLSTTERFRNFVLMVDWRLMGTPKMKPLQLLTADGLEQHDAQGKLIMKEYLSWGDSGVFLRGVRAAQVNIWCEPCGSGEVATKFKDLAASKEERMKTMPRLRADHGPGEWNRFLITMRGDRVSVVLNGVPVVDGARVKDVPGEGPITLQNHNDAVEFRNIFIKKL